MANENLVTVWTTVFLTPGAGIVGRYENGHATLSADYPRLTMHIDGAPMTKVQTLRRLALEASELAARIEAEETMKAAKS